MIPTSGRPTRDTVLYDGMCRFCVSQIGTLRRLDRRGRLEFVSLHDDRVAREFPELTHDMLLEQMFVVAPSGSAYGGAEALRYLSRLLPALWLAAPLLHLPGSLPLWQAGYRFVARNRYRIAGRGCTDGSCSIHARRP